MIQRVFCHAQIFAKNFTDALSKKRLLHYYGAKKKWLSEDIIKDSTVDWRNSYYLPLLCTKETKLRVFQFKFVHRRIATNDFLCRIGIKQVDSCSFCGETTETLVHLFWNCKHIQAFWKNSFEWISQNLADF